MENNIAECYALLKNIDMAKQHYNTALEYSIKYNYPQLTTIFRSNMAHQDILQNHNIDENIKLLNLITTSEPPIENKTLICENYYYLALGYLKKDNTIKAIEAITQAIYIAEKENFLLSNEKNLALLSSINYKNKDYEAAYLNAQKIIEYKEEIYNENKNKEVELLRTKFGLNQKENEIQIKEQELMLISERENKKNYIYLQGYYLFLSFLHCIDRII